MPEYGFSLKIEDSVLKQEYWGLCINLNALTNFGIDGLDMVFNDYLLEKKKTKIVKSHIETASV